jgi:hypothetical protein
MEEREVLFFYFVPDTTRDKNYLHIEVTCTSNVTARGHDASFPTIDTRNCKLGDLLTGKLVRRYEQQHNRLALSNTSNHICTLSQRINFENQLDKRDSFE